LIDAIGRGIGNTAAHEVAHQFLLQCCEMDALPNDKYFSNANPDEPDPGARGAYNAGDFSGKNDPSFWTGHWPSPRIGLHWENAPVYDHTPSALTGLENCLRDGWYKTPAFCASIPFP